jgi:SAM-dependent methyltransferase
LNGRITPFNNWKKGKDQRKIKCHSYNRDVNGFDDESLISIVNEYTIFQQINALNMAPPIKGLVFIKNVISDFYPGTLHCDPAGVYGYIMEDANGVRDDGDYIFYEEEKSPYGHYQAAYCPPKFELEFMNKLDISPGAIGDLKKIDNVIKGRLIDVRRSLFDMMTLKDLDTTQKDNIRYMENVEQLKQMIKNLSQFPHKQRKENYQSYYLNGEYVKGARDTLYRMKEMQIPDNLSGQSVLDLGCNLGSICCECFIRGSNIITGVDVEQDYIDCARALARQNGFNINYVDGDMTEGDDLVKYLNSYFKKPIDIIFALSLFKHVKGSLFQLLDNLNWHTCYLESNNVGPKGIESDHAKGILQELNKRSWKYEVITTTDDRSPRIVFKVTK